MGLFIPSIKLKYKGGWFVERRNQWENIFTFFFFLYGVEVAVEHFEVRKWQGFWEGRDFGGC